MSLLDSIRYRWHALTRPREHETELAEDMEFFLSSEARQGPHRLINTSCSVRRSQMRNWSVRCKYSETALGTPGHFREA